MAAYSGLGECRGQLGEDRQVHVQPHALDSAHPEGEQRPFVLEPAEPALDAAALAIEGLPTVGRARNEGVQPVGLDQ